MRLLQKILVGAVTVLGLAMPAMAAERAIIVLDASGSMWAQIDGKARITIARETLDSVLSSVSPDVELGLMAYGHRKKGDCGDIETLVEPATGTADAIKAAVETINPKGMTPLSDAVRLAAEDLKYTEEKATVILITDGLETCEVDPCALGNELEQQGIDLTVHVLGFGLSDEEGKQVACLAENTGGKYLSAQDGASLVEALTETVETVAETAPPVEAPEAPVEKPAVVENNVAPTVSLAEGGPDLTNGSEGGDVIWEWYRVKPDGTKGDYLATDYYAEYKGSMEPGDYILSVKKGEASAEQPVIVTADSVATPHFVLNGMLLKLHPRPSEGEPINTQAPVRLTWGSDGDSTHYGDTNTVVPAGDINAEVTIGEAVVNVPLSGKAGDVIDQDVIVGVGIAHITSEYVEGSPVQADISLEILKAAKSLEGNRESVSYGYGGDQKFELPPGDYVVTYDLGGATGEVPFSVKTGETIDVVLVLDAGVLVVTTDGDKYVELQSVAKSIEGKRTSFDYGYGPQFQTTLKAGDYIILSKNAADEDIETPVTIRAGERQEVAIDSASPAAKGGKKK